MFEVSVQKFLDERVVEPPHLVGRANLLDLPAVHHQHAVGQFQGLVLTFMASACLGVSVVQTKRLLAPNASAARTIAGSVNAAAAPSSVLRVVSIMRSVPRWIGQRLQAAAGGAESGALRRIVLFPTPAEGTAPAAGVFLLRGVAARPGLPPHSSAWRRAHAPGFRRDPAQ